MNNRVIKIYQDTFPNIEKFYLNNGGKDFVQALFLDKSSVLKKMSRIVSPGLLYETYRVLEPSISSIIVTGKAIKAFFSWKKTKQIDVSNVDRLFLNYAHLLKDRCKSAGIFEDSQYWLGQPYSGVSTKGLENKTIISLFQVLTRKDLWESYKIAVSAIFYVSRHNPNHYIRRSYTAFEFYLTYFALLKFPIDTELFFANHIDRWAILFDSCPQKRKSLVQHGIETKTADWPVKLNTVTNLYAFNEELGHDLSKALLSKEPQYRYMNPTIELVDDVGDANFKVLIVCHPAAMRDREKYLISHLQKPNITLFAKTHYTTQDLTFYEELQTKYNYHLITTQFFPKVDILISYRSTLVSEYEICGVPALLYSDYKNLDEIVEKIVSLAEKYQGA